MAKIKIFENRMIQIFFFNGREGEQTSCTVKFDDDILRVEDHCYETVWTGRDVGNGHYELSTADGNKATLHKLYPESLILEGHWIWYRDSGMWRIRLDKKFIS